MTQETRVAVEAQRGGTVAAAFCEGHRLRVAQVSFYADPMQRTGEALLRAWPTLPAVAAGVARSGVDVTVVQAAHSRQTLERDGVRFEFIDDTRGSPRRLAGVVPMVRRPTRIYARVAELAPDVVHVHGLINPVAIQQLSRTLHGTPVLVQDHCSHPPRGWRARVWRWASQSLAGVVFTAQEQARPFFDARAFRADLPVFEALEGSSDFTPGDSSAARSATGMFGDPCLLWTGRLIPRKDPLSALAAFELAAAQLPTAHLWCCFGDATMLGVVEQRIAESPVLRRRVTLLGRRPHAEMELLFRAADFFLQTSHYEGSGYSLIEALACGTTPLVTDIPASRHIIGDAGALTPVGDATQLAEAIVEWSRRDRAELRRLARERFERALTFDVIGHELRAAYETLARRS